MAADGTLLQGEVSDNPGALSDSIVIQKMLQGFLNSLIDEQVRDLRKEALENSIQDKDVR